MLLANLPWSVNLQISIQSNFPSTCSETRSTEQDILWVLPQLAFCLDWEWYSRVSPCLIHHFQVLDESHFVSFWVGCQIGHSAFFYYSGEVSYGRFQNSLSILVWNRLQYRCISSMRLFPLLLLLQCYVTEMFQDRAAISQSFSSPLYSCYLPATSTLPWGLFKGATIMRPLWHPIYFKTILPIMIVDTYLSRSSRFTFSMCKPYPGRASEYTLSCLFWWQVAQTCSDNPFYNFCTIKYFTGTILCIFDLH